MPTPEELAKQQASETTKNSSAIADKFDVAIETQNISEEERAELRDEFKRRTNGMPEKVAKAVMGQLMLKAMKMAKTEKQSKQEGVCARCGATNRSGSNFCGQCGNKL